MKAQRRHDLKTNTLAQQLEKLPFTLRQHGGKVLLGIIAVLLLIVLINFRSRTMRQSRDAATENLGSARRLINELGSVTAWRMPPAEIAAQVRDNLDTISAMSDDPKIQAELLVARGDLNWTLANLPDLPGASTQPALRVEQSKDQSLAAAEEAYQRVLEQHPDQTLSLVSARFGLAAVAEARAQWDAAAGHYQAIETGDAAQAFKDLAKLRHEGLSVPGQGSLPGLQDIRQPIIIGNPTTAPASTSPTTQGAS